MLGRGPAYFPSPPLPFRRHPRIPTMSPPPFPNVTPAFSQCHPRLERGPITASAHVIVINDSLPISPPSIVILSHSPPIVILKYSHASASQCPPCPPTPSQSVALSASRSAIEGNWESSRGSLPLLVILNHSYDSGSQCPLNSQASHCETSLLSEVVAIFQFSSAIIPMIAASSTDERRLTKYRRSGSGASVSSRRNPTAPVPLGPATLLSGV